MRQRNIYMRKNNGFFLTFSAKPIHDPFLRRFVLCTGFGGVQFKCYDLLYRKQHSYPQLSLSKASCLDHFA